MILNAEFEIYIGLVCRSHWCDQHIAITLHIAFTVIHILLSQENVISLYFPLSETKMCILIAEGHYCMYTHVAEGDGLTQFFTSH